MEPTCLLGGCYLRLAQRHRPSCPERGSGTILADAQFAGKFWLDRTPYRTRDTFRCLQYLHPMRGLIIGCRHNRNALPTQSSLDLPYCRKWG